MFIRTMLMSSIVFFLLLMVGLATYQAARIKSCFDHRWGWLALTGVFAVITPLAYLADSGAACALPFSTILSVNTTLFSLIGGLVGTSHTTAIPAEAH